MSTDAIKPCPFPCKSDLVVDEIEVGIWAVCCNDCRTIGPHCDGTQSAEVAIKRWNERAGGVEIKGDVETWQDRAARGVL